MASAVRHSARWTDAFVRARIGKSWGFLPSQLGLSRKSYPAFKRQQGMWHRYHTCLPSPPAVDTTLLMSVGRQTTAVENEAVRSLLWQHGREGGKRDVYNPTIGCIRRTYGYTGLSRPYISRLTFVGQLRADKVAQPSRRLQSFIPLGFLTWEEEEGFRLLDLWRQAFDSLATE